MSAVTMGSVDRNWRDAGDNVEREDESQREDTRGKETPIRWVVWAAHDEAKHMAGLGDDEKEAEADRLLRQRGHGGVRLPHASTRRRHRVREIPVSQLENPSYSGTRQLLESMADGPRLADADAQADLDEWVIHWEITRAIRGEPMLRHGEKEAVSGNY